MTIHIDIPNSGIIPALILKGKVKRYMAVRSVFINVCMREILLRLHESYWQRSHLDGNPDLRSDEEGWEPVEGRPDAHGNTWEQLRPSTYLQWKPEAIEGNQHLKVLGSHRSRAARDVLEKVKSLIPAVKNITGDGINIRTGRLLAATYPGPLVNNRLVTTKDQNIVVTQKGIEFNLDQIPYAEDVNNSGRPIIDDEIVEPWIQAAIPIALEAAERRYLELKERYQEYERNRPPRKR
jgi:hypothetical protein